MPPQQQQPPSRTINGCQARRCTYMEQINSTLGCVSIAAIFALHFLLGVAVLLCDGMYGHNYGNTLKPYIAFYNSFLFVALFWSIHQATKPGPLQIATVVNLVSIVFDIIVACSAYDAALWFLILNILFRPVTSFVLLRRAYERKRQYSLTANENISLGRAIRNLLYHQSQSGDLDLAGKPDQTPPLGVFATIPTTQQNMQPAPRTTGAQNA